MTLIFFGSPEDAVPALISALDAGHEVAAVYTRPDRQAGRSRRSRPTPVRVAAESLGLQVETPKSLLDEETRQNLATVEADIFVVVAYGRILPPEILALPRLGVVNIHPSLLPRHRGPSPVSTAILNGDAETGVSLMLLDGGMDTGPLLTQSPPVPLDGSERAGELTARLFAIGAEMLPRTLAELRAGRITPEPQDERVATVTRLIEKDDGRIDWARSTEEMERMTRAFDPWPGAFTSLRGKILKVITAKGIALEENSPAEGEEVAVAEKNVAVPGSVRVHDHRMFVITGDGALELLSVQPEGRNPVTARDLINGRPDLNGAVLGG
jgi:methionyl-tRNA formyltransferase